MLVDRGLIGQVEDGSDDDLAACGGVAGEPVVQEVGGGGSELLDADGTGLFGVEVDVEIHRTSTHGRGCVASGHEVEGVLGVGEDPDRPCPPDVELVGVAELAEFAGDATDGLVEQQGVGGVQGHHDVGGGGVAAVP